MSELGEQQYPIFVQLISTSVISQMDFFGLIIQQFRLFSCQIADDARKSGI